MPSVELGNFMRRVERRVTARGDPSGSRATARAPLGLCLISLIAGVIADRLLPLELMVWLVVAGIASVAAFAVWRRGVWGTVAVLVLGFAVAAFWHAAYWNLYRADEIVRWAGSSPAAVCLEARLLDSPNVVTQGPDPLQPNLEGERTRFRVACSRLRTAPGLSGASQHGWAEVSGRSDVWVSGRLEGLRVGDRVRIFGKLSRLRDRRNPGGFSPWQRGRAERILVRLSVSHPACVSITTERTSWDPRWWLGALHRRCRLALDQNLNREHAALAAAILLGDRDELDPTLVDSFFLTGTVHLLAISGLHLAILVQALFVLFRAMAVPRTSSLLLVMAATVFYALLTGARPPVVRATILVCMLCLELLVFRPRCSFNSLAAGESCCLR